LIRELESLDRALQHVDRLQEIGMDGIKCAALMCRYPLEDFMKKIPKYANSLGINADASVVQRTVRKLQWSFGNKEEVAKLKSYLNIHVASLNLQLLTAGLETLESSSRVTEKSQTDLAQALEDSESKIMSRMKDQLALVQWARASLEKLYNLV